MHVLIWYQHRQDLLLVCSCVTIRFGAVTQDLFRADNTLSTFATKILELIVELDLQENPHLLPCLQQWWMPHLPPHHPSFCTLAKHMLACRSKAVSLTVVPVHAPWEVLLIPWLPLCRLMLQLGTWSVWWCSLIWERWAPYNGLDSLWDGSWMELIHTGLTWKRTRAGWPQLYLYSQADQVVDHKCIDQLIEHRKKLGIDVSFTVLALTPLISAISDTTEKPMWNSATTSWINV